VAVAAGHSLHGKWLSLPKSPCKAEEEAPAMEKPEMVKTRLGDVICSMAGLFNSKTSTR
jgi:hypothetical protein